MASGGLILRFASGVEDQEINMWNELVGRALKLGVNTAQFVCEEGTKRKSWAKWVSPRLPGKVGMLYVVTFCLPRAPPLPSCCASENQLRHFSIRTKGELRRQ